MQGALCMLSHFLRNVSHFLKKRKELNKDVFFIVFI